MRAHSTVRRPVQDSQRKGGQHRVIGKPRNQEGRRMWKERITSCLTKSQEYMKTSVFQKIDVLKMFKNK